MEQQITDDIMIRLPAAAGPPTSEAIRLGKMEIDLVIKFLIHLFIFRSKKP